MNPSESLSSQIEQKVTELLSESSSLSSKKPLGSNEEAAKKIALELKDLADQDSFELAFTAALNSLLPQENSVKKIGALLDLSFAGAENGLIKDISMELLQSAFDCLTLDLCEELFDFLKARAAKFTKDMVPNKGKALTLLRLSNELLRRLSNSRHTVFCGKIRIFLANSFPLCERSGVNLAGAFNLENETLIDPPQVATEKSGDAMDTSTTTADANFIDHEFYISFWSAQKFFVNPKLAQDPTQWLAMCRVSDKILGAFDTIQDTAQSAATREFFYPKSLSSWNLFHLQLNDASFRNHTLIQFIILFEYLLTFAPKPPAKDAKPLPKGAFVLAEKQVEYLQTSREKVFAILRKSSSAGDKFVEILKFCIKCDNIWVTWKNEGCLDFERKSLQGEPPKKKQRTETASDETLKAWLSGKEDLSVIQDNAKLQPPSINGFLERLRKEMKPENDVEKQYRGSADEVYTWRAFRLMSQQFLEKFKDISQSDLEGGLKLPDLEKFVNVVFQPPPPPAEVKSAEKERAGNDEAQSREKSENPPSREATPSMEKMQSEKADATPKGDEEGEVEPETAGRQGMDVEEIEDEGSRRDNDGDEQGGESRQEEEEEGEASENGDKELESSRPGQEEEDGGKEEGEEEDEPAQVRKETEEDGDDDDGSRRSRAGRERRNTETQGSEEGEVVE